MGDGSGSKWGNALGWAAVLLERTSMERKVFHGAMNDGTVSMAEIIAYLAPLTWYAQKVGDRPKIYDVHIITDSQYVQSVGDGGKLTMRKHKVLWTAFGMFNRLGLKLHWHWLPAEHNDKTRSAGLNKFVDALSRAARVQYTEAAPAKNAKVPDPYQLNPWE